MRAGRHGAVPGGTRAWAGVCGAVLALSSASYGQELVEAFAFGSTDLTCTSPNNPDVEYTKVAQSSLGPAGLAYDADRGWGYEITRPGDTSRGGHGQFGPFDSSPNDRNAYTQDCPELLYDEFIGAKNFAMTCSVGPCEPHEGIHFRVDVPDGVYRFVAAFGDAQNPHSHTIIVEDGGEGEDIDMDRSVVLVQDFDQGEWGGDGVYARVGFDDYLPPEGDGLAPDPIFVNMDEEGLPTDDDPNCPTLEVTEGYLRLHQLQGANVSATDANGGDAVVFEIWLIDTTCPMGLRAARDDGGVRLTWRNGDVMPASVRVERNGAELAAAAGVDPPSYLDASPAPGLLEYELAFNVPGESCDPRTAAYDACIADLGASRGAEGVTLTWTNNLAYDGIEVRRDGGLLETLAGDATTYTDPSPPLDTITYTVKPTNGTCEATAFAIEVFPHDDVAPWTSEDIGRTLAGGIEKIGGDGFTIFADGGDIWGTSDAFRFTYREFEGGFEMVALLDALEFTHDWAKAGLMARASNRPDSAYVFFHATPTPGGHGVDLQWRAPDGAQAAAAGESLDGTFDFPVYLRLVRIGDLFVGSYSQDRIDWTDHAHQTMPLGDSVLVGVAVTSHTATEVTSADFREVSLEPFKACPSDLMCSCNPVDGSVSLAWANNYEYQQVRIYRKPPERSRSLIARLDGGDEEFTDTGTDRLSAGTTIYEVVPVISSSQIEECAASCEVTIPCGGGEQFLRADADGNGVFTIGDVVQMLELLFVDRQVLDSDCVKTADLDDNGDLTIGDAIILLNYLFGGGVEPKPPFPGCGPDPTPGDLLTCEGYPTDKCP